MRATGEAADILQSEEDKGGDVDNVADQRELRLRAGLRAGLVASDLLDILHGGDDEGDGGDEDDQEGHDGKDVGSSAGPGLLQEVPHRTPGENYYLLLQT